MKSLLSFALFCLISVAYSGCTLARVLSTQELMLVRGANSGIRLSSTSLAITDGALAVRNLTRLRIRQGIANRQVLYLPEAGPEKPIFELINQSKIRRITTGEVFDLPFRVFRSNGLAKAELRAGPGTNYKLYMTIPRDRFVLVRGDVPGWYNVQFEEVFGWIAMGAIAPVIEESNSRIEYQKIACRNCDGVGRLQCSDCKKTGYESCPSCKGEGKHKCAYCNEKGRIVCLLCKKSINSNCPSCKGEGFIDCQSCKLTGYFDCDLCRTTGRIMCDVCNGTLETKCYFCFGTKHTLRRDST